MWVIYCAPAGGGEEGAAFVGGDAFDQHLLVRRERTRKTQELLDWELQILLVAVVRSV